MIVINNVDSQKFTFNGVEYFKNFTPVVVGNKIRVLNTYDSSIELTDAPRLYSEFEVEGVVYGNVIDLQTALLPILYTRNSLLGDFLSSDITDYTPATTPLVGTEDVLLWDGTSWKKVEISELNKSFVFTIELIDYLTVDFYAPAKLKINSIEQIFSTPSIDILVNDSAYTLTNLISQGDKITITADVTGVINLNAVYE